MKKFVLLLMFIPFFSFSQGSKIDTLNRAKPDNIEITDYKRVQAGMRAISWHEYLTPFVGVKFSDAFLNLMIFLQMHLNMTEKSSIFGKDSYTYVFQESISRGKPKLLVVKFNVFTNKDGVDIIKTIDMSGSGELVIKMFTMYWPTKRVI